MRYFRKVWIVALLGILACFAACSPKTESAGEAVATPKVKAVLIYADWCASCKVLAPKVATLRQQFEAQGLVFSQLDFTDQNETNLFLQAEKQNVAPAMRAHLSTPIKTGQLILTPMSGEDVLGVITMSHSVEDIRRKFESSLATQSP